MRIESQRRVTPSAAGSVSRGAEGRFTPSGGAEASAAPARTLQAMPVQSLAAVLALQTVGDAGAGRRRAVRRASDLLDDLEALRADLLSGHADQARLSRLAAALSAVAEAQTGALGALIADIELRAQVELAKRGLQVTVR